MSLKGAPGCTRPIPCSPYLSRLYRAFHSWRLGLGYSRVRVSLPLLEVVRVRVSLPLLEVEAGALVDA